MKRPINFIIKETAIKCNLSESEVRKIVEGYYNAMETRYISRIAEFGDNWFVYRLNQSGRSAFIKSAKTLMRLYNEKRKEKLIVRKFKSIYLKLLQFIAKKYKFV
jgi:hypothetical protein